MSKKSKISKLHQTHGKIENPITLDQIWGETGDLKYGTLDVENYSKYLEDLNKSDLQSHASKIGLVPVDNREILNGRLIKEFEKHVSKFNLAKRSGSSKAVELSKEARDILSEGR